MSCKLCNPNQSTKEFENSTTHFQIDFGNCLTGYTEGDFGEGVSVSLMVNYCPICGEKLSWSEEL